MNDRVHPAESEHRDVHLPSNMATPAPKSSVPPPPGTYVIQVPKDQIYRVPPQVNSGRYEKLSSRKSRRNLCCCCLCWLIGFFLILTLLVGVAAGVVYLVFRPETPSYSVDKIAVSGFNLSSSSASISPSFNVTVRADNPNKKIGIYYQNGSSVRVYFTDVELSDGALPAFYQPPKNLTVFSTSLDGKRIVLGSAVHERLVSLQMQGRVPLKLLLTVPVKLKIGSLKTSEFDVEVSCDVAVDKLAAEAKVVSKDCDFKLNIF